MEYVVLVDGRVVWGPRPWNPFSIESRIEDLTQQAVRIAANPTTGKIDDRSAVLEVTQSVPGFDPIFEQLDGPTWRHNVPEGSTVASYTVVEAPLPMIRAKLKTEVASKRWIKETSGLEIAVGNNTYKFATDRDSRDRMTLQSVHRHDVVWKLDNNSWVEMSADQLVDVVTKINKHVQDVFAWESGICARIETADVAQLKQIYTELQE